MPGHLNCFSTVNNIVILNHTVNVSLSIYYLSGQIYWTMSCIGWVSSLWFGQSSKEVGSRNRWRSYLFAINVNYLYAMNDNYRNSWSSTIYNSFLSTSPVFVLCLFRQRRNVDLWSTYLLISILFSWTISGTCWSVN